MDDDAEVIACMCGVCADLARVSYVPTRCGNCGARFGAETPHVLVLLGVSFDSGIGISMDLDWRGPWPADGKAQAQERIDHQLAA